MIKKCPALFTLIASEATMAYNTSLKNYCEEATLNSLITKEQEIELAQRIEKGVEARKALTANRQSIQEEIRLAQLIRDGNAAWKAMFSANMRMVLWVAKKAIGPSSSMTLPDLIQEGSIGLIKAIDKFDWRRNVRFGTYASRCIKSAIRDAIRDKERLVRVPAWILMRRGEYEKSRIFLTNNLGREPMPHELCTAMDITLNQEYYMRCAAREIMCLKECHEEKLSAECDQENSAIAAEHALHVRRIIRQCLQKLTVWQKIVVVLITGMGDGKPRSTKEVAKLLNVTMQTVRDRFAKAIAKMRKDPRLQRLYG